MKILNKQIIFTFFLLIFLISSLFYFKVDSSIKFLGIIEIKGENKSIKTEVGGMVVYNAIEPFKKFQKGEVILKINNEQLLSTIENLENQQILTEEQILILGLKLSLIDDHNLLKKIRINPKIKPESFKELEDFSINLKTTFNNFNSIKESNHKKIDEIKKLILIQDENVRNLFEKFKSSEKLFQDQVYNIDQLENDRQIYLQEKFKLSDYQNNLINLNQNSDSIIADFDINQLVQKDLLRDKIFNLKQSLLEITQQLDISREILKKYEVKSPIDGIINNSSPLMAGYVLTENQIIGEITPSNSNFIVKGFLPSLKRQHVQENMSVRIKIMSLNNDLPISFNGKINSITANVVNNSNSNSENSYQVEILSDEIFVNKLSAGQPVEIYLLLFEQTVFNYLLSPILSFFSNTFTE